MLSYYYGKNLEELADSLIDWLKKNPPENLLSPEIFVVQNNGIGQWLSLQMARKEGIAANLKFEFPSERIWSLLRTMDSEIPQVLPSDRGPLTWGLMRLLRDQEVLSNFDELHQYISHPDWQKQEIRRWQLCSKLADIFDQYLVYRPGMLLDWEQGKDWYPQNNTEQWQAELWRLLIGRWREEYDGKWLHRAQLQQQLLEALDHGLLDEKDLPERVTVFGVSGMPPEFVRIITRLSKLIHVQIFQRTVDPDVTEAEAFQNPLLQSLAVEETKFSAQLSACIKGDPEIDCHTELIANDKSKNIHATLFQQVKGDLQRDVLPEKKYQRDTSIRVQACHSPMREIEVLYDQLLSILEEKPGLTPDDILIMTPNVETYAPLIDAVFSAPDEGQPDIPFSIADRGVGSNYPAIQTFLKILHLCQGRFKVTEVLDLLDADPVRQSFGFTDDDLNRLDRWIRDNRIRWGIDGSFKKDLGVPTTGNFTWKSGLNRMLLGYAMKSEENQSYHNIFPYDEIATSDDATLIGKFTHFMRSLFDLYEQLRHPQEPKEWCRLLTSRISEFLPDNRVYFLEVSKIRGALEQLKQHTSLSGYNVAVPFRIIYSWLENKLEEQSTGGGRIGRGVTFSSLIPMKNIPFEVIGMIGMNEGSFPRSKIPIEFDLMYLEPEQGDPSRSQEDRYLFLENVLSAGSHLYFSYVGQSNRQDTDFPPSVVLRQFMDYLEENYGIKSDSLINKHPLQAFSPAYFKGDKFFSYSESQRKISEELLNENARTGIFMNTKLDEPGVERKSLSLNEFISFFQHPARYLFRQRLGIYLGEEDVLTDDREPFKLSGLDNYQVGQELLDRFIKGKPLDEYRKNIVSRDLLPDGWSGEEAYRNKVDEVNEFGENIRWVLDQPSLQDREVNLEIDEFHLTGKLTNIFGDALIKYRFGRMRPKDLIELWILHLIFQDTKPEGHSGISYLLTRDKKKNIAEYRLSQVENNTEILSGLLKIYWEGLQQCTYFFPEASFAYAEAVIFKNKSVESGLYKASHKWNREYSSYPGEADDPYNKLMLGTKNPLALEAFREISAHFWTPFFEVLNQKEEAG
ncbi:MAG TPA: exodeoxyribonuclease V subunit gamma [Balneolaceae bacterium]|nr:exodeoxyribonuclease V subunit gamma [Balneolaceae bacterium]